MTTILRFAVLMLLLLPAGLARGSCLPVAGLAPTIVPAAAMRSVLAAEDVAIEFLGHASFLIESPGGVALITDYNGHLRPPWTPDIVTMNNTHSSHYTDAIDPAITHVLRGWNPDGGTAPAHWDLRVKDMRVRNVATNTRDWSGGTLYNGNSIFIIETAGLCIAHLGHLHHLLTLDHLADIGQIDILMVPVDGSYTLDQFDMGEVLNSIKPQLVLPMHYFTPRTLQRFIERAGSGYAVTTSADPRIVVSRNTLPAKPEILILPGI